MKVTKVFTMTAMVLLWVSMETVEGHGYLLDPPGRASMWRAEAGGYGTPKDENDNHLSCGGLVNQLMQGYKCGICGDLYQGPRVHEAGGIFATGIITRKYTQGQVIEAKVQVTANHLGWFQFKICPNNNFQREASQECLDSHVLELADGSGSQLYIGSAYGTVSAKLKLPSDVTCTQCVFQWRYHVGNSWGVGEDGRGCLGCGFQEEFYGCADVSISPTNGNPGNNGMGVPTVQSPVWTLPPSTPSLSVQFHGAGQPNNGLLCSLVRFRWANHPDLDAWCQNVCLSVKACPSAYCIC